MQLYLAIVCEQLTRLSRIPTPAALNGNLSPTAIFDPATQDAAGVRSAFPGNSIPSSRFDPVSLRMLRLYPEPNRAGVQNYVFNTPRNLNDHQVDTRFDWRVKDRGSLFVRYSHNNYYRLEPGLREHHAALLAELAPKADPIDLEWIRQYSENMPDVQLRVLERADGAAQRQVGVPPGRLWRLMPPALLHLRCGSAQECFENPSLHARSSLGFARNERRSAAPG